MFKQIFKLTVVSVVWKKYKAGILSTLGLFIYYWLVEKLHADYLHYLSLQQSDAALGSSFLLKWLFLIGGLLLYLGFNFLRQRPLKTSIPHVESKASRKPRSKTQQQTPPSTAEDAPDPFAHLRDKPTLRSKGDFIIEKHDK